MINLAAGTYSASSNGETLPLTIDIKLTIAGASAATTIIDGTNHYQVMGIFANPVNLSNVTIAHGNSAWGDGGGIINYGMIIATNCIFSDNFTDMSGAGVENNGVLSVSGSTFSGNDAGIDGGGIKSAGVLTITSTTFTDNGTDEHGGGINNAGTLAIANSTFSGNFGPVGGGIYGTGTIANSTIISTTAVDGGGVYGQGTITDSTIISNTAVDGGGGLFENGTETIVNSTISSNSSNIDGGGIYNNSGTTSLFNVTLTSNTANPDGSGAAVGGGVANASGATFNFKDSIIARNYNILVVNNTSILNLEDCSGTINSQGYNIVSTTSDCTINGSVTLADPKLGSLQNNGGPTFTHALLTGSPAIDMGNPSGCTDNLNAILNTDQRGFQRPWPSGGRCDIGAYEYSPTPNLFLPFIKK